MRTTGVVQASNESCKWSEVKNAPSRRLHQNAFGQRAHVLERAIRGNIPCPRKVREPPVQHTAFRAPARLGRSAKP